MPCLNDFDGSGVNPRFRGVSTEPLFFTPDVPEGKKDVREERIPVF
jgi:hypothetical protein